MQKIKKGDDVIVITGKDKGKRGIVSRVMLDVDRVLVDGINMVKKHQKPNPAAGAPGGIIDKEMPMAISNVALFNSATGKADRVGIKQLDDGRKVRYFKSNGEVLDS
ncbi:MAG: 50S ribosomal protein L24 [Gammaproteobacteria bacterium]|nr:50S ribosomal protein L24 [Gammaproteobacteria bacterium]MDH5659735.1 50S ribosomal protein L24 [Gammaproteobacteria bacterium]